MFDPPTWVVPEGHGVGLAREGEEAAQNPQQTVRLIRGMGILAVQPLDFGERDLASLALADFRQRQSLQQIAI
jgi:hypothetical protein